MEDLSTGKLSSPKAMTIFSTGKSPGENFFSLYLTSDLSSVAKIRKELLATDGKGRRVRQTVLGQEEEEFVGHRQERQTIKADIRESHCL